MKTIKQKNADVRSFKQDCILKRTEKLVSLFRKYDIQSKFVKLLKSDEWHKIFDIPANDHSFDYTPDEFERVLDHPEHTQEDFIYLL